MSESPIQPQDLEGRPRLRGNAARHARTTAVCLLLAAFVVICWWPSLRRHFAPARNPTAGAEPIAWKDNLEVAMSDAKRDGKPLLVDFVASWCGPCQAMKRDVWSDPAVAKAVAEGYVPVALDVDDARNSEAARRYGVTSIPAIFILSGDGKAVRSSIGYVDSEQMLSFLGRSGVSEASAHASSSGTCTGCWDALRSSH